MHRFWNVGPECFWLFGEILLSFFWVSDRVHNTKSYYREKITTSPTRWIKFATFLTNCAIPLSFCMTTNWHTPILSLRTFCSWIRITHRRSMPERWEIWAPLHFTTNRDYFPRIAIFVGSKTPTFVWLILAARHLIMNTTAPLCQHVTTEHQKSFLSWVGLSLATCGPSDASCSSSTLALPSSKRTTIANIWRWWKEFSARFPTEWRGKLFHFLPTNDANNKRDLLLFLFAEKLKQSISSMENSTGMKSHRPDDTSVITANPSIAMSWARFRIICNCLTWFVECLTTIQQRESR